MNKFLKTKKLFSSKKFLFIALGLLLVFTAFIRFYRIESIPEGFAIDEAAFGYNAYSILETGRDEYGKLFPLTLQSFDDYKAALFSYFTIPFIAVFGLNEFAVRAPSALIAVLLTLLTYFLVFNITKRKDLSFLTALLISICPIMIFLGRIQSDPILAVFLVLLGVFFYLKWVDKKRLLYLFSSLGFFLLSLTAYQSPRVFLPLFLPILFLTYIKDLNTKNKLTALIAYTFLLISVAFFTISGSARVGQTSIFTFPEVKLVLEESIRESGAETPIIVTRIFNNKPLYFGRALIENYFSYLDFEFLFFQAQSPVREVIKNFGFLYLIDLPFLLFGVIQIFRKKIKWGYLAIAWVLITPLALSPFSIESPNMHRFLLAVFPLQLLIAFGILDFINLFKNRKNVYLLTILLIIGLYFISFTYYMYQLFINQPVHRPWSRNHPHKELILELKKMEPKYKKIIVSNGETDMYMFYLFFNKVDPRIYQEMGSHGNIDINKFGKSEFIDKECPITAGEEGKDKFKAEVGVLYVNNGTCVTPIYNIKYIKTIRWGDGSPAFKLMEYKEGIREVVES